MSLLVQAYLIENYGLRMTLEQVAQELSITPQTIRNQISADRFPIPTVVDQGRRWVDFRDFAEYLDEVRKKAKKGSQA